MALKPLLASFVAVTTHVATAAAVRTLPLNEHPVPLTERLTAPAPDPPVVVTINVEPGIFERTVFEIFSVA